MEFLRFCGLIVSAMDNKAATVDGSTGLPGVWAYRTRASEAFRGKFLTTITGLLMKNAAKGVLSFYVPLPLAYRRDDDNGKSLRGSMLAALQREGYHASLATNEKYFWSEERDDSTSPDSPDDKMMARGKSNTDGSTRPHFVYISADKREQDN